MRLSLWVLIFHRVDFSHFILLLSKYWILSIINQALSKTKELPEIESRYFASEEEFPSLLASRQFIKAVILTDVCRYRFYAIPKLCIIVEFFTLHMTAKEMYAELKDRLSPSGKTYFFLDEVQEIKGWEKVVNVEILLCAGFQLKVGNYLSCGE